ncbi:MAG: DUF2341 domain-containing protein [Fibrobacterales bacterium]
MTHNRASLLLCIFALSGLMHCSVSTDVSKGGSIEVENPITADTTTTIEGTLYTQNGIAARAAQVTLLDNDYVPLSSDTLLFRTDTDSTGLFRFTDIPEGAYRLFFLDTLQHYTAASPRIAIAQDSTVTLTDTLTKAGSLSLPLDTSLIQTGGLAYIPGTLLYTQVNKGDTILQLDGIPAGTLTTLLLFDSLTQNTQPLLDSAVQIISGDTLILVSFSDQPHDTLPEQCIPDAVDCSLTACASFGTCSWTHHIQLEINTTQSGIPISEPVSDFPLLVRLDTSLIDFSTAQLNGEDIRFSLDTLGLVPLNHEIAHWDSQEGVAELWVRIPLISPDRTMPITLAWGNSSVENISTSNTVFSPDQDFLSVWHCNSITPFSDATHNDTATHQGIQSVPGIISQGINFEGEDYVIIPTAHFTPLSDQITIALWTYGDGEIQPQQDHLFKAVDSEGERILTAHAPWDDNHVYWDVGTLNHYVRSDGLLYDRLDGEIASTFWEDSWNYYVFTANRLTGDMKVYINGEMVLHKTDATQPIGSIAHFYLGSSEILNENYDGIIDEFRVSSVVRSDSWIALSYGNQSLINKL